MIGIGTSKGAKRRAVLALLSGCAIALSSCASTPSTKVSYVSKSKSSQPKEYFSQAEYGVKASPRVVNVASAIPGVKAKRLPRGGGRAQVGKPYKVKGRWYTPKLDPDYQASGTASWYGDAFHGRLTANGEIYDMNHLSAAHPTMPLPSYARVTNTKNGNSVIVRVNDRGPYAHNRLIDLSKRAAQMLDYTHSGTAQVKVEYVGPAPVNGVDDEYLMASFQPGTGGMPVNPGEQPVMVASADTGADPALPGVNAYADQIAPTVQPESVSQAPMVIVKQPRSTIARASAAPLGADEIPSMPAFAPTPMERPETCQTLEPCQSGDLRGMVNSYASERVKTSHAADAFRSFDLDAAKIVEWKQGKSDERILVGTLTSREAKKAKSQLAKLAKITIVAGDDGMSEVYAVPLKGAAANAALERIWQVGYDDAFIVR